MVVANAKLQILGDLPKGDISEEPSPLYVLIRTAKMTYSFEDTMYGTLGPERTVWDEEAHESTKKTIKKQKESKYI